jgi:1,4-alpha-glucan branching enzyme
MVVVSVLVPRARTVELSADFTKWQPLALRMSEAGRWEATVALPPGTYHVNLRIDGDRWTAPPGVVSVDDGFGGTAGLVVAQ